MFRETRWNVKVQLKVQLTNDVALRRLRETHPWLFGRRCCQDDQHQGETWGTGYDVKYNKCILEVIGTTTEHRSDKVWLAWSVTHSYPWTSSLVHTVSIGNKSVKSWRVLSEAWLQEVWKRAVTSRWKFQCNMKGEYWEDPNMSDSLQSMSFMKNVQMMALQFFGKILWK